MVQHITGVIKEQQAKLCQLQFVPKTFLKDVGIIRSKSRGLFR
jgi:hypothetical protein